jgi:hypothetical protein
MPMLKRLLSTFGLACLACVIMTAQPAASEGSPAMSDSMLNARLSSLGRMYKLDSTALAGLDKIITFDKAVYVGKVHNITFTEVRFICPPDGALNSINKSRVSQILYSDGRRDVFIALDNRSVQQKELVDTSRIMIKNQKDWMKVLVTENPDEVTSLVEKGDIKIRYESEMGNANNEELMRGASVLLKKKAALMKAHYVLVETKFFHKAYGDPPQVEVTARAFGY